MLLPIFECVFYTSVAFVLVLNQALLVAKVCIKYLIDSVPAFIRDEQARSRAAEYQISLRQRQESHAVAAQNRVMRSITAPEAPGAPEEEEEGMLESLRSTAGSVLRAPARWASNIPGVNALLSRGNGSTVSPRSADHDPSLHSLHDCGVGTGNEAGEGRAQASARDAAIARLLEEQQTSKFGIDPLSMTALTVLPAALQYWGISPWLYIPCAVLYFSYLQAQKDRNDRKLAIGIVSDPALIKLGMCPH